MRGAIATLIIIYLIGVGVVLAPTVSGKWNSGTASELSGSVTEVLPSALAWPVTMYHRMVGTAAPMPAPMPVATPAPTLSPAPAPTVAPTPTATPTAVPTPATTPTKE
jgi:hypothetical protein